jgi:C_GCAxxG_C_C family probable redox protein
LAGHAGAALPVFSLALPGKEDTMNRADRAVTTFQEGFSCSQAILSAFAEGTTLDRDTALKVAAGFGGGMGRMAQTCGAVTGAYLVIGLKHGATRAGDRAARDRTYELVREFTRRFKACHGSVVCKDLLGCDISTPDGFKRAQDGGLISTICTKLVRDAAEILEAMVL